MASTARLHPAPLERLAWPTYGIGFLMIVLPLTDFAATVWPLQPGDVMWRYGAAGLFSGFLLTPLFGVALIGAAAAILEHRFPMLAVSLLCLLGSVGCLAAPIVFGLDVLQMRAQVNAEALDQFDTGAGKAIVKYGLTAVAVFWFGIVGVRASKEIGRGGRSGARARRTSQQGV